MTHEAVVHPHNDLLNLAHYHREVIRRKQEEGDQEALGLDCMSAIIALAFALEAIINVIGQMKIPSWMERARYHEKIEMLADTLGFKYDPTSKPFCTFNTLKTLRDQLAHGKPIHRKSDKSTREDLLNDLRAPWDEYANPDFVNEAGDSVDEFHRILLDHSGIDLAELLTEGSGVFTET